VRRRWQVRAPRLAAAAVLSSLFASARRTSSLMCCRRGPSPLSSHPHMAPRQAVAAVFHSLPAVAPFEVGAEE
jgi:hypothetical protein